MKTRGIPRYTLVWVARYTLGARYLSKNTVLKLLSPNNKLLFDKWLSLPVERINYIFA